MHPLVLSDGLQIMHAECQITYHCRMVAEAASGKSKLSQLQRMKKEAERREREKEKEKEKQVAVNGSHSSKTPDQ